MRWFCLTVGLALLILASTAFAQGPKPKEHTPAQTVFCETICWKRTNCKLASETARQQCQKACKEKPPEGDEELIAGIALDIARMSCADYMAFEIWLLMEREKANPAKDGVPPPPAKDPTDRYPSRMWVQPENPDIGARRVFAQRSAGC